ncbi:hypothetical protein FRB94_006302 [Tulasnella sp. JGI-2019a]|nr:hypothetical protein FRB94_006302 [Tulasnella sp. JGI-2019a]
MELSVANASNRFPTLLVYDILLSIFFHLDESKGTLRSAGLVCQAWYDPAMDVLWAEHIPLHDLLGVLSPLEKRGEHSRKKAFFMQPLTPQRWSRFRSLAHRVRYAALLDPPLDSTLISELSSSRPGSSPLLPGIRGLCLRVENIQHAFIWMNSSIDNLDFSLTINDSRLVDEEAELSEFFDGLGRLCPDLRNLRLEGQWTVAAMEPIGGLRGLRAVELSGGGVTTILLELAKLPAVEILILSQVPDFPLQWPQLNATPFPKLKTLHIDWPTWPGATTFLHALAEGGSHLKTLELGDCTHVDLEDIGMMTRAAGEHRHLERLVIYCDADTTALHLSTLSRILQCDSLIHLILTVGGDITMVDEDFAVLVRSLPRIAHFLLENYRGRTGLTLRALSIAVASWPYLETLS